MDTCISLWVMEEVRTTIRLVTSRVETVRTSPRTFWEASFASTSTCRECTRYPLTIRLQEVTVSTKFLLTAYEILTASALIPKEISLLPMRVRSSMRKSMLCKQEVTMAGTLRKDCIALMRIIQLRHRIHAWQQVQTVNSFLIL